MYPCEWCDRSFRKINNLNRHINSVHHRKDFICESCNYVTTRKDNLVRHCIRLHTAKCSTVASEIKSESNNKKRRKDEVNWGEEDLSSIEIDNLIPQRKGRALG